MWSPLWYSGERVDHSLVALPDMSVVWGYALADSYCDSDIAGLYILPDDESPEEWRCSGGWLV